MARLSYGGDIFSPVRSDTVNDSLKDKNSGIGSISEDLEIAPSITIISADGFEFPEHRRRYLPLGEVTVHHSNKNEKRSQKRSDKNITNSNLVSITPCVKIENICSGVSINKLPKKSKHLQTHEDRSTKKETESKDGNSQFSNTRTSKPSKKKGNELDLSKFITIRGGESRKAVNRSKSSSDRVFSPLEILEEKENNESLENSNKISSHDDSGENKIKRIAHRKTIKSESSIPTKEATFHSHQNELIKVSESKASFNTDNSELGTTSQTETVIYVSNESKTSTIDNSGLENTSQAEEIGVAELKMPNIGSSHLENTTQGYVGACLPNESNQVQAKIIEKIITDTINPQFDVVRQQLYLQQISMLKVINQTQDDIENRYSKNFENLYNIIEVLLEENRQLRNAIIANR